MSDVALGHIVRFKFWILAGFCTSVVMIVTSTVAGLTVGAPLSTVSWTFAFILPASCMANAVRNGSAAAADIGRQYDLSRSQWKKAHLKGPVEFDRWLAKTSTRTAVDAPGGHA